MNKQQCKFCCNIFGNSQMLRQHQTKTKYCLKIQQKLAQIEAEAIEKAKIDAESIEQTKELLCQYCGKNFKTKYILQSHQLQAKYCLKIQESKNSQEIISSLVICKYCNKNSSSSNSIKHNLICREKIQFLKEENIKLKTEKAEEINKLKSEKAEEITDIYKEQYIRAQNTIEEIAKKPTTYQKNKIIQNNIVSGLTPLNLDPDRVLKVISDKYTTSDFYGGQRGAAQMIYKHLVTDENGKSQIICTDTSRGKFHYKDMNGEEVIDLKNVHLIGTIQEPLKKKAGEITVVEMKKNPIMMETIGRNMSDISKLDYKSGVFNNTIAELSGTYCARPIIINKITLNNVDDLNNITDECLTENVKNFSIDHVLKGPEGYAEYAVEYALENSLLCDDIETLLIKYKDKDGVIIMDPGMLNLSKKFFGSIKDKNKELIMSYCANLNFAENMDKMVELLDYKAAVDNCADGVDDSVDSVYDGVDDSKFCDEFVKLVLSKI